MLHCLVFNFLLHLMGFNSEPLDIRMQVTPPQKMLLCRSRIRGGDDDYDDPDAVPCALLQHSLMPMHCLGFILAALPGVRL